MEWRAVVIGLVIGCMLIRSGEVMKSEGYPISCHDMTRSLAGCLDFIISGEYEPEPDSDCCDGVRHLDRLASTVQRRRAICSCLQDAADDIDYSPDAVRALPRICGATHAFSFDGDCSTVA